MKKINQLIYFLILVIYFILIGNYFLSLNQRVLFQNKPDRFVQKIFEEIYSKKFGAPKAVGSVSWMPILLANLSTKFKYHGIDIVQDLVIRAQVEFSNQTNWKFSLVDFTQQKIPQGYDLIFSRDGMQHLPLEKVINSLEIFTKSKAKYLLIGSYVGFGFNKNIQVGDFYRVDLTQEPFNLKTFSKIYRENLVDGKSLILYDIQKILSKINFEKIRYKFKNFS